LAGYTTNISGFDLQQALAVENVVFRFIEARTVQRWGMQT
jgi:hypothetical protein